jgi:hypothetical protein
LNKLVAIIRARKIVVNIIIPTICHAKFVIKKAKKNPNNIGKKNTPKAKTYVLIYVSLPPQSGS